MMMPDDDVVQAAELALGLLDGDERAAAARRMLSEPAFAREVERWRDRFGSWFLDWPEARPPSGGVPSAEAKQAVSNAPARWRWIAGGATALAACLALALIARPERVVQLPAPAAIHAPAPLVAVIAPADGKPFLASLDRDAGTVRLAGTVTVPKDRDAELWAIGGDGVPQALGVIAAGNDRVVVPPARRAAMAKGTTLAISIEPVGGSPTGKPTGPVVATGSLGEV